MIKSIQDDMAAMVGTFKDTITLIANSQNLILNDEFL